MSYLSKIEDMVCMVWGTTPTLKVLLLAEEADKEIKELREFVKEVAGVIARRDLFDHKIDYCSYCERKASNHSANCFMSRAKKLIGDSDV